MRRHRQSLEELLNQLSPVVTGWQDAHAEAVIQRLIGISAKPSYRREDLARLLDAPTLKGKARTEHFNEGLTTVQLFLDMSKDELTAALRDRLGPGMGIRRLKENPESLYAALEDLGILDRMAAIVNAPVTWTDLLTERLKGGCGSAIKGQRRGRFLEDFVEELLGAIFGEGRYDARCRFIGAKGVSDEKADFAIPSKEDPVILIEAEAYGATGSKQTDVLGDISRICSEKRSDTDFLLVTDGITWRERMNDLRKLIELQNRGEISRIYTHSP
ncbi:MAG: type II restriction endonuclease [Nitrococcus sp.]|nr:type II restriction endonuclease [Nitrococcus sp.]